MSAASPLSPAPEPSASANPLRVAVIGVDGVGKSATTLRAIERLGRDFVVAKPGRNPFVVRGGERVTCAPRTARFFERLFAGADATRRRAVIGATRIAFVRYQGWLEPHLVARHRPDVVLGTRCMILDPAVYADFYAPRLARVDLSRRLRAFRRLSGLPFRDLYLLLEAPAEVAMDRIRRRVAGEARHADPTREHWLHLHEEQGVLGALGRRFGEALEAARRLAPFRVVAIDTASLEEVAVADRIAAEVRRAAIDRAAAITALRPSRSTA